MRVWKPDPSEPQLMDWWRPLMAVARAAIDDEVPWPIHLDEFELVGRVDRRRRPGIWIYHHRDAGEILVDDYGRPHRFIPYSSGPSAGRFKECDVRRAVWAAGLPHVVTPVPRDWPPRPSLDDADSAIDAVEEELLGMADDPVPQRGHLRLVR